MCYHTDARFPTSSSKQLPVQLSVKYHQYLLHWLYAIYKSNSENWHLSKVINGNIDALCENSLVL